MELKFGKPAYHEPQPSHWRRWSHRTNHISLTAVIVCRTWISLSEKTSRFILRSSIRNLQTVRPGLTTRRHGLQRISGLCSALLGIAKVRVAKSAQRCRATHILPTPHSTAPKVSGWFKWLYLTNFYSTIQKNDQTNLLIITVPDTFTHSQSITRA